MFKRLLAYLKSLFQKPEQKPQTGTSAPAVSSAVLSLDTPEGWEAYRNSFVPSTRSFVPTWEQKLVRDQQIRAAADSGSAPDRTGFELKAPGYMVLNTMIDKQAYTFYVGKAGTVSVFPDRGNQLIKVNGQPVIHAADIHNVPVGPISIAVESVTGQVGVRVW